MNAGLCLLVLGGGMVAWAVAFWEAYGGVGFCCIHVVLSVIIMTVGYIHA